jgi:hypothetical protein
MKTSAVVVLVGAFTIAGGLAVMNKACKKSPHPWCRQAFYEKNGKALSHGARTRARVPTVHQPARQRFLKPLARTERLRITLIARSSGSARSKL